MSSNFLVSYCTTTMNRLHHVEPTLMHNLYAVRNLPVELVVLDYGSTDGFYDWIMGKRRLWSKQKHAPNARCLLHVYRFDGPKVFHTSHAKNMAHRVAQGEIVCNIDADTYILDGLTELLIRELGDTGRYAAPADHVFYGRVALLKTDFMEIGGYDEDLVNYSYDDTDICLRASRYGLVRSVIPDSHNLRITHSDEERTRHMVEKDVKVAERVNQSIAASRTHWKANVSKRVIGEGEVRLLPNC